MTVSEQDSSAQHWLDLSLGQIARRLPGATAVFHRHQLDFCCGGQHSLRDAAAHKGLDPQSLAAELAELQRAGADAESWESASDRALIDHLLSRYHQVHRAQLAELIRLAQRVETVHGDRPECPRGLATHLHAMGLELESHMRKEEQILFPMLAAGQGAMARGPVSVMRHEHDEHGEALRRLDALTDNITLPKGACNTWRALYLGLREFKTDLMDHIHLENNLLFARVDGSLEVAHG